MITKNDEKKVVVPLALKITGAVIGGLVLMVLFAFVFGYAVMWLWNALIPEIFGLKTISYLQAIGLIILTKLLFGNGFHPGKHKQYKTKKWHSSKHDGWGKWKYYDEYWKSEGKDAFEKFVSSKEKSEESVNIV